MSDARARNFFLNEQHELSREERAGGGSALKLAPINWRKKRVAISESLDDVGAKIGKSKDPSRKHRYYMLVDAEREITKVSESAKKPGEFIERVDYAGAQHSKLISRLGLDVLDVTANGDAVVHVTPEGFDRLSAHAARMESLGQLDQSRWAFVRSFSFIPASQRIDKSWLDSLSPSKLADSVVELQPLLRRLEADEVIRAIADLIRDGEEKLHAAGTDFSGRMWLRGMLRSKTLEKIASLFFSVQSIHRPLQTSIALASRGAATRVRKNTPSPMRLPTDLPTVGVVDCGVPDDHVALAPFVRGTFQHADCHPGWLGPHGSLVASRIVFGDPAFHTGLAKVPPASVRYLDIRVAMSAMNVDDKSVVDAIERCIDAYADVRVFNLSFSDRTPLARHENVLHREKLRITQNLDNLAFARDVLIVVAAGNSAPGQLPRQAYPLNYQDPDWGLGHWACTYNGLTCGSFVSDARPSGVAARVGVPSPFCKVGPGIHNSPVPDFSAPGGDVTATYHGGAGLGVFACNQFGDWEDYSGTSFATPLLARECALALDYLKSVCPPGTRPFAATVKAILALTATRTDVPPQHRELADRTLGRGEATASSLTNPTGETATFIWQGVLESSKDLARLSIPVPSKWIAASVEPVLDIVVAWDTPVNAALTNAYGCRNVTTRLRPFADSKAVHSQRSGSTAVDSYPLASRRYDLKKIVERLDEREETPDDFWVLEVFYEEHAAYCPGLDFTPEQRVGIAFALRDIGEDSVSPQAAVAALPVASTMVRLSEVSVPVRAPVVVTTR